MLVNIEINDKYINNEFIPKKEKKYFVNKTPIDKSMSNSDKNKNMIINIATYCNKGKRLRFLTCSY